MSVPLSLWLAVQCCSLPTRLRAPNKWMDGHMDGWMEGRRKQPQGNPSSSTLSATRCTQHMKNKQKTWLHTLLEGEKEERWKEKKERSMRENKTRMSEINE